MLHQFELSLLEFSQNWFFVNCQSWGNIKECIFYVALVPLIMLSASRRCYFQYLSDELQPIVGLNENRQCLQEQGEIEFFQIQLNLGASTCIIKRRKKTYLVKQTENHLLYSKTHNIIICIQVFRSWYFHIKVTSIETWPIPEVMWKEQK